MLFLIQLCIQVALAFLPTISSYFYNVPIVNSFIESYGEEMFDFGQNTSEYYEGPNSPYLPCSFLPYYSIQCLFPTDLSLEPPNSSEIGCRKWGANPEVLTTDIICQALPGIECSGPRNFTIKNYPCIKYSNHLFLSTLLCSIFFGILGVDRFILNHTGTGVAKLLTLGGLGVWWIVDIVLIIIGHLGPADSSSWKLFYE